MKNNLKQFREEAKLTLKDLGDSTGMSAAAVHHFENQRNGPTLKAAYAIAAILDKTVQEIWPDTTEIVEEETVTVRRIIAYKEEE